MNRVRVHIANPDARVERTADGFLWISASHSAGDRARSQTVALDRAWSTALEDLDDGTLIGIRLDGKLPCEVRAFRAPSSSYDVFFVRTDDGVLVLTDQFSCALAAVPLALRQIPPESLADHLLFRTVPGTRTYVSAVERVGHGEEIVWRAGSRHVSRRIRRRLSSGDPLGVEESYEVLSSALAAVITPLARLGSVENMLSGGVDSTLVHTYLDSSTPSVSAALTSPEFQFEVDYAVQASRILGNTHRLVPVQEDVYLSELERCVEGMALPPHHLQTVLFDAVFRSGGRRFVTAQFADALFGLGVSQVAERVWRLRWLWSRVPHKKRWGEVAAAVNLPKVRTVLSIGDRLSRATDDPLGLAMRLAMYTDLHLATQILGPRMVSERLEARLEYVEARLDRSVRRSGTLAGHLEVGHYIDFFCDDAVSLWRQAAQAQGKALYAPFSSRRLGQVVLGIPAPDRYVRNGRVKHILKHLLAQRLPTYPVDRRKGTSGVPFARFWTEGPLKGATERYPLPDFLAPGMREAIVNEPGWLTWNAFTLALWQKRVLQGTSAPRPVTARLFEAPRTASEPLA